jgi:hypothetical membrane protein
MKTKHMLVLGSVIPVIFWGTLTVCGYVMGDYNHLTRLVSELGAMGTRTQYLFTAGLLACAVLSVLFVVGLSNACRERGISAFPVWIILTFSVSLAGAALFPLPLRLHLWAGMPSIVLFLSPLAALILWRGEKSPDGLRAWTIVSLAIMLLGFLAFLPEVMSTTLGMKQRFFHIGWSLWFISLGRAFLRSSTESGQLK